MTEQKPEMRLIKDFSKIGKREQFADKWLQSFSGSEIYKLKAMYADFLITHENKSSTLVEAKEFLNRHKVYEAVTELVCANKLLKEQFNIDVHEMVIVCKTWWIDVTHFKILKFLNIKVLLLKKTGEIKEINAENKTW